MIAHNASIPGWAADIYPWLEEVASPHIPQCGTYLEIGTFLGASLAHMGTLRPDIALITVDPWEDEPSEPVGDEPPGWRGLGQYTGYVQERGGLFLAFLRTMLQHAPDVLRRTRVLRGTAATVGVLSPVDVLFIDGAHDRRSVDMDITAFAPLVKRGGLIAGHDWPWLGVKWAVDRHYSPLDVHTRETVWWVVQA